MDWELKWYQREEDDIHMVYIPGRREYDPKEQIFIYQCIVPLGLSGEETKRLYESRPCWNVDPETTGLMFKGIAKFLKILMVDRRNEDDFVHWQKVATYNEKWCNYIESMPAYKELRG